MIANVAFSVLVTLVINLVAHAGLDVGSSAFTLAHLALAGALGLARPRSPAPARQREDRPLEQDVTP